MAVTKRISKAERQARAAVGRAHPFVACVDCSDGWVYVTAHGLKVREIAQRCSCWYVHQRRVAQLVAAALAGTAGGARP